MPSGFYMGILRGIFNGFDLKPPSSPTLLPHVGEGSCLLPVNVSIFEL